MANVKKKRRIGIWIGALAIVAVLAVITLFMTHRYVYDTVVEKQSMVYVHRQWNSAQLDSALLEVLGDKQVVNRVERLLSYFDFDATAREGVYRLEPGMSVWRVALKLARGSQTPVRVTFNNVRTIDQMAERIAEQLCFSKADLLTALQNDSACAAMGFTQATLPALFLPDTYEFYWTVTPQAFVQKMEREYRRYWQDKREQQAEALGLTPIEVATLASIVEEETNKPDEMGMVAGLYMNRLRKGMPLQADPTVKFACGDFALQRILKKHLAVESPYNTYRVTGLPPGPIRIASKQVIDAVLNHRPNDYLYMCAREDFSGYHNFAVTLAEHQRNAARYQRELNRRGIR
ncbi:endolytic transglycosylase MltG [Barnesiella sp. An55]|uniref:endolytic transglycosylase MltG n=1 Tax=Barnesiella sp. An55 TaxID=1965646 RepID=UPI000B39C5E0|nr:endolytic transglycosylase MltG [Barnesiella sp. An55]OUN71205.1 aminodeoxychorismate lyase [Barnesiella sp. An55]HIZ26194.1 endolytic transglycosylase MltG [Candidatus Barnesiella merdipullorum]